MKHLFISFFLLVLVGCGSDSNDVSEKDTSTPVTQMLSESNQTVVPTKSDESSSALTPQKTEEILSNLKQDAENIAPVEESTPPSSTSQIPVMQQEEVHKVRKTVTLYVHGYDDKGVTYDTTYGYDAYDPLLDRLVELTGFDTLLTYDPDTFSNIVTITPYYGTQAPDYYTTEDIADIERVTNEYGGGIPRYAMIIAKYVKHVMAISGAEYVNFVSASMGSLVTRWLIEKDVEHLASEKKIGKWYTLEGVIRGNKIASNEDLVKYANTFQEQPIDVTHMSYAWIETYLHHPREEAASVFYQNIEIAQESSTKADEPFGILMPKTPNDGYQAVVDTYFATFLPQAKYKGKDPAHIYFYQTHLGLKKDDGAWASVATFLLSHKRVKIVLSQATVDDIHEHTYHFNKEAEIVFESQVFSPHIKELWNIDDAIDERMYDSGALPIHKYKKDHENKIFDQVLFDSYVLKETDTLVLQIAGYEIDQSVKYGVHDELGTKAKLGSARIDVALRNIEYTISAKDWSGIIKVEVEN